MLRINARYIGIRGLMLSLLSASVLVTLATCLVVAHGVVRDALIHSALESHRAYAYKVASGVDAFIDSVHERLQYSSELIGHDFSNRRLAQAEAKRLKVQDAELELVVVADASGTILDGYPPLDFSTTEKLNEAVRQAASARLPLVSQAFTSPDGTFSVLISNPIRDGKGDVLGVLAGLVKLREGGVMSIMIGTHQLADAFAFVVDDHLQILYHPDPSRLGAVLNTSATAHAALRGGEGELESTDYRGIPMLAGYAEVKGAHWAVVTQQPRENALQPLSALMHDMLLKLLPVSLLGLVLILAVSTLVTRPLRQLANSAQQVPDLGASQQLKTVNAWYAEAAAIRKALLAGVRSLDQKISDLNHVAESDPLTGLINRRGMNAALAILDQQGQPYCALALDIDHFKRVNDTWGHDVGDVALQHIAGIIQACSRTGDLACRAGGEEFSLLLPDTSLTMATEIAERIRTTIATRPLDKVGVMTISIGVAGRESAGQLSAAVLKKADERLYLAKQAGRNQVVAQG
ncbi:diguanylate cyclase [Pseudomonas sp. NPDC089408]|uniref:diguanylate cyclase n=1 Tax=Pseudomonas sp. NPDC089408 TaxID=3364465 RepID=UPI003812E690